LKADKIKEINFSPRKGGILGIQTIILISASVLSCFSRSWTIHQPPNAASGEAV